jgi:hypothetical protein
MMNHWFRVVLALSLPLIAITVLLISTNQANPRPSYQVAVEQYVAYRRSTAIPTLTIQQVVPARLPQNFRAEMSKLSFGNATYYATDWRYDQSGDHLTDVGSWPAAITATMVSTQATGYGGGMPMPYPPNDLWCIQLSSPDPAAPKVVLAGLHQDIYNAEWIVHEVTDPATVLPTIGCRFSNQ